MRVDPTRRDFERTQRIDLDETTIVRNNEVVIKCEKSLQDRSETCPESSATSASDLVTLQKTAP